MYFDRSGAETQKTNELLAQVTYVTNTISASAWGADWIMLSLNGQKGHT